MHDFFHNTHVHQLLKDCLEPIDTDFYFCTRINLPCNFTFHDLVQYTMFKCFIQQIRAIALCHFLGSLQALDSPA